MRLKSRRPRATAISKRNCKKINVWGAIGWYGAIRFKLFTNNLTAYGYEHIIEETVTPYVNQYYTECNIIQDNSSIHTSNICLDALSRNNLEWVGLNCSNIKKNTKQTTFLS